MNRSVLLLSGLLLAATASARTWHVPAEAPTIQAGIDSALVGDVVELAPGTYHETGIELKRGITLRGGAGGPGSVVLDAQYAGPLVSLAPAGETAPTVVQDLSFARSDSGAFDAPDAADLTIERCIFRENENVGVLDRSVGLTIVAPTGPVRVLDCLFLDNRARAASAAAITAASDVRFERCLFARNHGTTYGAAIGAGMLGDDGLIFDQCTFTGNTGAGYWTGVIVASYGTVNLSRTIVARNEVRAFTQASGHFGAIAHSCSDFYLNQGDDYSGWSGGVDSFSADPCFCDADAGDYTLAADSWCLPGHHSWDGCEDLVGAFGAGCAEVGCAGPVAIEPRSWSTVRGLFD